MIKKLKSPFVVFYALFFLTGISGLIYESVWARYLKLFLGHSSYGQLLTLCIYMGGLAIGSFLAGRYILKLSNPVKLYGFVEIIIGLLAFAFHPLYSLVTEFYYQSQGLNSFSPLINEWIKILISVSITLPGAILLGMTFPLMAAGLTRQYKDSGERAIPGLYYFNASGAALGVLLASFYLVPNYGIDGSLIRAGIINVIIGLVCIYKAKGAAFLNRVQNEDKEKISKVKLWLGFSFFTGFSSFIYEVVWIRMLSLMLGSSSHSFDLMISAFIAGLALGAFRVRQQMLKVKEQSANAYDKLLAHAQLKMGVSALLSLFLWPVFFKVMNHFNLVFLDSTEAYPFWNIFRYSLCVLWMVPTSYYAGKTLPLLTCRLQKNGHSEKAIGWIYGSNTLGAISGAALAGLFLMPVMGLKGSLWLGALTDIAAGWMIWFYFVQSKKENQFGFDVKSYRPYMALAIVFPLIAPFAPMNEQILTAGMFRGHKPLSRHENQKVSHGKTATISFHESAVHYYIKTNGKPDASISKDQNSKIESDQLTQAATAFYSSLNFSQPYNAAVVGFGSGMTVHYLLADPYLKSMDMIEIEPEMVELAKGFRPVNERAFSDKRVKMVYDDARTYFHSERKEYDLILSVPSNPWVSGVSSLFTSEFYRHIKPFLSEKGALVQWIQQYEFRSDILLNILNTLSGEFECVRFFQVPGESDLLLMAGRVCPEPTLNDPNRRDRLYDEIVKLGQPDTLFGMGQYLSSSISLKDFLKEYGSNSDFNPVVDTKAEEARFTKSFAGFFEGFYKGIISLRELDSNEIYLEVKPRLEDGQFSRFAFDRLLNDTLEIESDKEMLLNQWRLYLALSKEKESVLARDSLLIQLEAKVEKWQNLAVESEVKFRHALLTRNFELASQWGDILIEEFYPHTLEKNLLRALVVAFYRAKNKQGFIKVTEEGLKVDKSIDFIELEYYQFLLKSL